MFSIIKAGVIAWVKKGAACRKVWMCWSFRLRSISLFALLTLLLNSCLPDKFRQMKMLEVEKFAEWEKRNLRIFIKSTVTHEMPKQQVQPTVWSCYRTSLLWSVELCGYLQMAFWAEQGSLWRSALSQYSIGQLQQADCSKFPEITVSGIAFPYITCDQYEEQQFHLLHLLGNFWLSSLVDNKCWSFLGEHRLSALIGFLCNIDRQCSLNVWHRGLLGERSVMYQDKEILRRVMTSKHPSLVDCF